MSEFSISWRYGVPTPIVEYTGCASYRTLLADTETQPLWNTPCSWTPPPKKDPMKQVLYCVLIRNGPVSYTKTRIIVEFFRCEHPASLFPTAVQGELYKGECYLESELFLTGKNGEELVYISTNGNQPSLISPWTVIRKQQYNRALLKAVIPEYCQPEWMRTYCND